MMAPSHARVQGGAAARSGITSSYRFDLVDVAKDNLSANPGDFMRSEMLVAGAVAGLLFPLMAMAEGAPTTLGQMTLGYTYFNKPGADLQVHDVDVKDCATEAARTISFDEQINVSVVGRPVAAAAGQATASALEGVMRPAYHRGAVGSAIENCMVVRGWRVVKLPDDEGRALAKLAPSELSARLAPWVGASNPHGQVVRVWNNDADDDANSRFALRPDHTNDGQLSLIEATSQDLHQFDQPRPSMDVGPGAVDPRWPKGGLAPAALGSAPDGSAILIVKIKAAPIHFTLSMAMLPNKASSPVNGAAVLLSREGPSKDAFPSRVDHAPDFIETDPWHGDTFAFAVPPGRWRISGIGKPMVLNFCLGAPSFEVKAGEVVYAGLFDLGAADLGPDLDLAPAKAWLAGHPQAQTIRAAVYSNGSRGVCAGNAIYALEVRGAPFAPGYLWGGAPRQAVAAAIIPNAAPAP
jgi:hypothetical protein